LRKKIVGVIGGSKCSKEVEQLAQNLGKNLAKVVDFLVCGGLGGVMRAVCKGFKEEGGSITLGIIPSYEKKDANEYIDIIIPTGLGMARNVIVVRISDIIIALPGEYGTLSEIAYALQFGIPVISLRSWEIPVVIKVKTVKEAIREVKRYLEALPPKVNEFKEDGENYY